MKIRTFLVGFTIGAGLWLLLAACTTPPPPGEIPPASVDTAGELNAWMADHPSTDLDGRTVTINDGTVLPPAGATLANGRLVRTVDSTDKSFRHVEITGADVTLSSIVIVGDAELGRKPDGTWVGGQPYMIYNPAKEGQHGIALVGAVRTTLRAVHISFVWGDGIYMRNDVRDLDAEGIIVDTAGRAGIAATDAERVRIDNVFIDRSGIWLINLEPHGAGRTVRDFTVSRLSAERGSRSVYWLNAAGPTKDSLPFDCGMKATIDRPTGINTGRWFAPRLHNCLAPGAITLTGSYS